MQAMNTQDDRIIMGIDPGNTIMGYAIIKVSGKKLSMMTMGFVDLRKVDSIYNRLGIIGQRVEEIIKEYTPHELAIESPFIGKNIQTALKLGRAQGVAIATAINHGMSISEYAPMKIKQAVVGNGMASKEQVADMIKRLLKIEDALSPSHLDSTDALAAAYCHYFYTSKPVQLDSSLTKRKIKARKSSGASWADFVNKNPERVNKT